MASGLSFHWGVALNLHLNPCPYTTVPNLAGMELVPQSGSTCSCKALCCPIPSPCRAAALPIYLLHLLLSGVPGPLV